MIKKIHGIELVVIQKNKSRFYSPVKHKNMLGVLFPVPTSSELMTSVGSYSTSWFTEFLPVAGLVAGLVIGGLVVAKVIKAAIGGAKKITGGAGGGRRGRR